MSVAGSLLSGTAALPELSPVWRAYWQHNWDRTPNWPRHRLAGFFSPENGRAVSYHPYSDTIIREPYIADFPDGRSPFIGVVTISPDGKPSPESGVLQYPEPGHLLTVAPTRTGKGACHIIPNLLLYAGSAVVIDVKGENYSITSKFRATQFEGSRVIKFSPFEETTECYNPIDFIRSGPGARPSADTFDDARLLADMLIPGKAREEYWDTESRNLVAILLMYVASRYPLGDERRTMSTVADLLFRIHGSETDNDGDLTGIELTMHEVLLHAVKHDYTPLIALTVGFGEHEPKVKANILSSCRADMQIWNSPALRKATSRSDFHFSDLKASMCRPSEDNPAPTTLYVVIPPEYLHTYRSIVRIMVGLGTVELTRRGYWTDYIHEGWREKPPCPVLFLLDELPILGHMAPILNGLSYLAGYGVQIWSFCQNIGQLKEIYGEAWHNFPANSAVTSFFGVNDPETAEYVSKMLGDSEEVEQSYYTSSDSDSSSSGTSFSYTSSSTSSDSRSSSSTSTEHVRFYREPLAKPAEIRALDNELQLVFIRQTPPILSSKLSYYRFPLFDELYGQWTPGKP